MRVFEVLIGLIDLLKFVLPAETTCDSPVVKPLNHLYLVVVGVIAYFLVVLLPPSGSPTLVRIFLPNFAYFSALRNFNWFDIVFVLPIGVLHLLGFIFKLLF